MIDLDTAVQAIAGQKLIRKFNNISLATKIKGRHGENKNSQASKQQRGFEPRRSRLSVRHSSTEAELPHSLQFVTYSHCVIEVEQSDNDNVPTEHVVLGSPQDLTPCWGVGGLP